MLLRSQSIWDTLPREIKEMIVGQLCDTGAGTIRQVNREWRDIVSGGRKTSIVWIYQNTSAILWGQASGAPLMNIQKGWKNWEWYRCIERNSPLSVLEDLHYAKIYTFGAWTTDRFAKDGDHESLRAVYIKYGLKFNWVDLVNAGDSGHIDTVRWMLDNPETGSINLDQHMYEIMREEIYCTDMHIVLSVLVDRGIPIPGNWIYFAESYSRPVTLKYLKDTVSKP